MRANGTPGSSAMIESLWCAVRARCRGIRMMGLVRRADPAYEGMPSTDRRGHVAAVSAVGERLNPWLNSHAFLALWQPSVVITAGWSRRINEPNSTVPFACV
jgi:hypothetical protein